MTIVHETHRVTEYEKHRNMVIVETQGNGNRQIDLPEWSSRIDVSKES